MIPLHARAWLVPALLAVAAVALGPALRSPPSGAGSTDILRETFGYTAQTPSDVPWAELVQGCRERDCIPSIDAPRVRPRRRGARPRGGRSRARRRPLRRGARLPGLDPRPPRDRQRPIAGEPIAVTWCPLCGSGLAFLRAARRRAGRARRLGTAPGERPRLLRPEDEESLAAGHGHGLRRAGARPTPRADPDRRHRLAPLARGPSRDRGARERRRRDPRSPPMATTRAPTESSFPSRGGAALSIRRPWSGASRSPAARSRSPRSASSRAPPSKPPSLGSA